MLIPPVGFLVDEAIREEEERKRHEEESRMGHITMFGGKQIPTEAASNFVLKNMQYQYDTYKDTIREDSKIAVSSFWHSIISQAAIQLMDESIADMDPVSALGYVRYLLTKMEL